MSLLTGFVNNGSDEALLRSLNAETPSEDLIKAMNKEGLVQKEVQYKTRNGKIATRKQWMRASYATTEPSSKTSSDSDSDKEKFPSVDYSKLPNTAENREKLRAETNKFAENHRNPTAEERKKVSDARDLYRKLKDEAWKPVIDKQKENLR